MSAPAEARMAPAQLDESALRALVEAAFDALVIAHAGRVVFANRAFCQMSGWSMEEIRGRSVMDFVAEESRPLVMARMMSGDHDRYEARGLRRDGSTIAVEICARECEYQGQPARVTAIRYIEDRRRAEEALRRSEARLRGVIERLPDMIVVQRAGVIVFANPSALAYVGATRLDQLVGRALADMVHPDEREAAIERAQSTFENQVPGPLQSFRTLRGDGKYGVLEVASAPMDFDGEPAVLVIARDVSERKELETRLLQADLLASMGMLAAGITHEINNPLAYILLNLDLLANRVRSLLKHSDISGGELAAREREALGQEITRLLADTREGAGRVQRIVHDFRVFARGGDGRPKLLDLREVLDSTVKLTQNELRHRARLTRDYQPVPLVNADEARLGQLFLNLLVNALQALPMDSSPEATEIRVATRTASDGAAVVDIADSGVGIPQELLDRVFEPFFTTKPADVGTGLGLSICRSIVTGLGGTIEIQSEPAAPVPRHPAGGAARHRAAGT
ncbi:MAG: PAS domain S-box protein [Polyangiaceae bacterium]